MTPAQINTFNKNVELFKSVNYDLQRLTFKPDIQLYPVTHPILALFYHELYLPITYNKIKSFYVINVDGEYITNVGYDAIEGFIFKLGSKDNAIKFSRNAAMEISLHEILNKYGILKYTVEQI